MQNFTTQWCVNCVETSFESMVHAEFHVIWTTVKLFSLYTVLNSYVLSLAHCFECPVLATNLIFQNPKKVIYSPNSPCILCANFLKSKKIGNNLGLVLND